MDDPRGPIRTITAIEECPEATYVTLSCGHIGTFSQHFHYKLGNPTHCFQCGPHGTRDVGVHPKRGRKSLKADIATDIAKAEGK